MEKFDTLTSSFENIKNEYSDMVNSLRTVEEDRDNLRSENKELHDENKQLLDDMVDSEARIDFWVGQYESTSNWMAGWAVAFWLCLLTLIATFFLVK